jgi:hypothetical protein
MRICRYLDNPSRSSKRVLRRTAGGIAVSLTAACWLALAGAAPAPPHRQIIGEKHLVQLPETSRAGGSFAVSPDGRRTSYAVKSGAGFAAVANGSGSAPLALAAQAPPMPCSPSTLEHLLAQGQQKLEQYQREAYAASRQTPPTYSADSLARGERQADEQVLASLSTFPGTTPGEVERLRAKLIEQRRKLAEVKARSPFEDQLLYGTLRLVVNQMSEGVDDFQSSHPGLPRALPDLRQVLIGTLPYRNIDASEVVVNPDDKGCRVYLVVVNAGLLRFASAFAGILARALAPAEPQGRFLGVDANADAVAKHLDAHPQIVGDFEALMRTYLLQGVPDLATENTGRNLAEPYATLAAMMYRAALVYTLGHEFGHVVYDQSGLHGPLGQDLPEGWSEEYFADGWGMTLSMMAKGRNNPTASAVQGAALFFIYYDLLEKGISLVATGEDTQRAATSHPPANRRKERISRYLLAVLHDFYGQEPASRAAVDELLAPARNMDAVADALWRRARPGLRRLFQQRARLAPAWQPLIPAVR